MAKKKDKLQVINNIQELNLEIDYDKLAEAIVKANQIEEENAVKKRAADLEEWKRSLGVNKHEDNVCNSYDRNYCFLFQGGGMMNSFVNITDVCSEIFAGGDAPKSNMSESKTDAYKIPIFSNGEANDGLYGYTNFARVTQPSITVSARGTIGFVAVRNEPFVPIVRLISLTPDPEKIELKYLYYAIQNYKFDGSGTSIPQLTVPMLKKYSFPLPTKEQQLAIIDQLDNVCNLISLRQQQLSKLDELVKSRFIELFGDPVSNPMGWKTKRFDALCENLDSRRKPITASEREAGIYPYYGASGVVDYVADYLFDEDILLVSEDGANLLMRSTPIAFSVSGKVWVNNHAHVVRFEKMSMQKYIEVFFSMIDISEHITGSTQPKLNQAKLNAMMFPVPDNDRLEAFLSFVKQTDKSKFEIQQSLEKLETLKKALMQKYFG